MDLYGKYVLYNLLYTSAGKRLIARQQPNRPILPWHLHKMVMERVNWILAPLGEKFTDEEYISTGMYEISVEE